MRIWAMTDQDVAVMTRDGWLSRQPAAFRADLLRRALVEVFEPGETFYHIGDPPGGIYGLVWGLMTITSAPGSAMPRVIHVGAPGLWTGEAPYMIGCPRLVALRAVKQCRALHVPLDAMEAMTGADPLAARNFGQIPLTNMTTLLRMVHDLLIKDPDRRIGAVLLRIEAGGPIPLAQAEIGDMACASRKQVNFALRRFGAAGWVRTAYRSVTITDPPALSAFVAGAEGA
jgi:CRP/FNR family transcriptional regulator, cyclic AMP receptor protein